MFILEKILNKSNSYQFYKKNFEKSSKVIDELEKELKTNKKLLRDKNNELNTIKNLSTNFNKFLIKQYNNPTISAPFSKTDKNNFLFMELIADYLVSIAENLEDKPLISVIMPVYNRKDIVMNSIESVLSQSYSNFELIIVDDASTDGTTDLLKKIEHDKVKVVFHDKNKFCAGARNTGLKEAKGELISYLDSDNLFDKRYLAAVVGAFSILPDADAVYTAQYRFENIDQNPFLILFGVFNRSLLKNSNYIDINSFSHRKSVYESIGGFDETYDALEDWDFIMRIDNNYKIYSIPVLLSLYYLHAPNRTTNLISSDYIKEISDKNEVIADNYSLDRKINILIPIYKNDFNIENCVKSILESNLKDIKLIISNNCSNINLIEKFNGIDSNLIKIIESKSDEGFIDAVNQGLAHVDKNSDVVLLNQNAVLMHNSLESMQKYAYELNDCGLVVSQEVLKDSNVVLKCMPYVKRVDYGCDISTTELYNNVQHIPIFHDGDVIEMEYSSFFCTYIKRDILNSYNKFNENFSIKLLSEYVQHVKGLKIYHVSEAVVINNSGKNYQLINNKDFESNDYEYKWNF